MNISLLMRIRELAEEKGISIRKLERELGFSNKSIPQWDDHMPSIDKVEKVADYFGVTVDYLLGKEEDEEDIAFRRILHDDPELRSLLKEAHKLPRSTKKAIIEMVKQLGQSGDDI